MQCAISFRPLIERLPPVSKTIFSYLDANCFGDGPCVEEALGVVLSQYDLIQIDKRMALAECYDTIQAELWAYEEYLGRSNSTPLSLQSLLTDGELIYRAVNDLIDDVCVHLDSEFGTQKLSVGEFTKLSENGDFLISIDPL